MVDRLTLDVYIVSDATGHTAESVVRAVLVQFPGIRPRVRRFSGVRTPQRIAGILDDAERQRSIVIYSLVNVELSRFIRREASKRDLLLFDVLGPLLNKVRRVFRMLPLAQPGLVAHVQEEAAKISAAIEYTLRHDDGLEPETLGEADLVILGVSRTCKTPTSIFLACNQGLKVANVPIVLDRPLPAELRSTTIPKFGFTIDVERLVTIRRERYGDIEGYTAPREVLRELEHARGLYRRCPGLRVVDVTHRSIEEIADSVLDKLADHKHRPGAPAPGT